MEETQRQQNTEPSDHNLDRQRLHRSSEHEISLDIADREAAESSKQSTSERSVEIKDRSELQATVNLEDNPETCQETKETDLQEETSRQETIVISGFPETITEEAAIEEQIYDAVLRNTSEELTSSSDEPSAGLLDCFKFARSRDTDKLPKRRKMAKSSISHQEAAIALNPPEVAVADSLRNLEGEAEIDPVPETIPLRHTILRTCPLVIGMIIIVVIIYYWGNYLESYLTSWLSNKSDRNSKNNKDTDNETSQNDTFLTQG